MRGWKSQVNYGKSNPCRGASAAKSLWTGAKSFLVIVVDRKVRRVVADYWLSPPGETGLSLREVKEVQGLHVGSMIQTPGGGVGECCDCGK